MNPYNNTDMKTKRLLTLAAVLYSLTALAQAQTYDTISGPNGRYYKYHYSSWFDSCSAWTGDPLRGSMKIYPYDNAIYYDSINCLDPLVSNAKTEYVSQPTAIKGVAVVTADKGGSPYWGWWDFAAVSEVTSDTMAQDTCFVFNVANGEMSVLDFSRWDTATPKIYKVPWNVDSVNQGFAYLKVFEANFKNPIEVNDTFYIVGTPHLHEINFDCYSWMHPPHFIAILHGEVYPDDPCYSMQHSGVAGYQVTWGSDKPTISSSYVAGMVWGAYFPILSFDSVRLSVQSADPTMGTVTPGDGPVLQWVTHTITAHPRTGYKFTHWNDGNTENPRRVLMESDSTFTAYFAPKEQYHVAVSVDNPEHGYATGSGTYYELDTVRMEAFPSSDRYRFSFWGDGNPRNPRYHIVTGDTAFIAFFRDLSGIDEAEGGDNLFTLTPNPATGSATLTIARPGLRHELVVHNAAGHEVMYKVIPAVQASVDLDLSHLPAGAYFVTLSTPASSATQRLVVR